MMHGTELNSHFSTMLFDQIGTMKNDGTSNVVDPGLYYPAATDYCYYYTGVESPGEQDDHRTVFGLDGADIQYVGAQTESFPYVYYAPSYGYGESSYNPYNPYIPGAVIGLDGTFVGTQSYYTVLPYQNSASFPGYYPAVFQHQTNVLGSSSVDSLIDAVPAVVNKGMAAGGKPEQSSPCMAFPRNHSKPAPHQACSMSRMSEGSQVKYGTSKQHHGYKTNASGCLSHQGPSLLPQGANGSFPDRAADNISHGKILSQHNQLNLTVPTSGGFSNFASSTTGRTTIDDSFNKFYYRRWFTEGIQKPEPMSEQNRGPRAKKSKNEFVVKAYTTQAGEVNSEGNIVISADQYNRDDFPVDYVHAKFFVIKSYSEDDVHKSVKYNVWSSTPNGNKKLNSAYEDAQRIAAGKPGGCPIFLFFSVNASGQHCGVAEMVGTVDFLKDMDFWQQDKWSGSFPVKWHIIKDVPSRNFRHVILENNEHKPVTNSRDTQEIMYRPGMGMLKIFKSYIPTTSLLDDFMYYEKRQRIMHDGRARLLPKNNTLPFEPSEKLVAPVVLCTDEGEKITNTSTSSEKIVDSAFKEVPLKDDGDKSMAVVPKGSKRVENGGGGCSEESGDCGVSSLKIGSLTINSLLAQNISVPTDQNSAWTCLSSVEGSTTSGSSSGSGGASYLKIGSLTVNPVAAQKISELSDEKSSWTGLYSFTGGTELVDTVTEGSLPVKVNRFPESSVLRVGTIRLDPRSMQLKRMTGNDS